MSIRKIGFVLAIFVLSGSHSYATDGTLDDLLLRKVIAAYKIESYVPPITNFGNMERLGRQLFFDPVLSGPRTVSCSTCHPRASSSVDGLRLSIGIGAEGQGLARVEYPAAFVVPRNSLPLFNRGGMAFTRFFWDGRVQTVRSIESPLGKELPAGFKDGLAVASVMPLINPDEMLGRILVTQSNPEAKGLLSEGVVLANFRDRSLMVFSNLVKRLMGDESYMRSLARIFDDRFVKTISIADIGNALSAYIRFAFATTRSRWDEYVRGFSGALTSIEKRGALLFFGKGRCVVCHSGSEMTDMQFYGLAIPAGRYGSHGAFTDYGRARATGRPEDKYLFRTPSLRNVVNTGPWGHNGSQNTLSEAIEHHINPIPALYKAQIGVWKEAMRSGRLLSSRSAVLADIGLLSTEDIQNLVSFLGTLTSGTVVSDCLAVPQKFRDKSLSRFSDCGD